MTDGKDEVGDWNPALRAQVGGSMANRLRADSDRALAIALSMAPDGGGPGWRLHRYEQSLRSPRQTVAYQKVCSELSALTELLEEGDPGALEFAIVLFAQLDAEVTVGVAEALLLEGPWQMLGLALSRGLGAASSERSFELLLAYPHVPYLRNGLSSNGYPDGVERARETYASHGDLARPELDPRERGQALPVLAYLVRFDFDRAYPELVRLIDATDYEVTLWASHRLFALNTERSTAVLLERLRETKEGEALGTAADMGLRTLLGRDADAVVGLLGGVDALLSSGGAPRLDKLVRWLAFDSFQRRGQSSFGWLASSPTLVELCRRLKQEAEPELARTAGQLLATLPPSVAKRDRGTSTSGARATPSKRKQPSKPSAALLREMTAHRAALERLHAFLVQSGYRFAAPKQALVQPTAAGRRAIAQLEKAMGPLPAALEAFWTIVGSVDLRGQDPSWPRPAFVTFAGGQDDSAIWHTDPLLMAPVEELLEDALDEVIEGTPLPLVVAPDEIGKAGYSGGQLTIWLPGAKQDPVLVGGRPDETLRAHLKRSLAWAGMPGFEHRNDAPVEWLARARKAMK